MKRLWLILFVIPLFAQTKFGLGLGVGQNGGSFSLNGIMPNDKVFHVGVNMFNGRSDKNTYDFNPNLYDDADRGKLKEMVWITYGIIKRVNNNAISISAGLSLGDEYYKKYDSSEILSDDGNYFVKDDNSNIIRPTILIGTYFDMGSNKYENKILGITLNLVPIDIGINYFF